MTFTVSDVAKSLADYLSPHFPGVTFYEDPNQQGSAPPARRSRRGNQSTGLRTAKRGRLRRPTACRAA